MENKTNIFEDIFYEDILKSLSLIDKNNIEKEYKISFFRMITKNIEKTKVEKFLNNTKNLKTDFEFIKNNLIEINTDGKFNNSIERMHQLICLIDNFSFIINLMLDDCQNFENNLIKNDLI